MPVKPRLPFDAAEWIAETRGLTNVQKGVWMDLRVFLWDAPTRGEIVDTWEGIGRRIGETAQVAEQLIRGLSAVCPVEVSDAFPGFVRVVSAPMLSYEKRRVSDANRKAEKRVRKVSGEKTKGVREESATDPAPSVPPGLPTPLSPSLPPSPGSPPATPASQAPFPQAAAPAASAAASRSPAPPERRRRRREPDPEAMPHWQTMVDHMTTKWEDKKNRGIPAGAARARFLWDGKFFRPLRMLAGLYMPWGVMALWDEFLGMDDEWVKGTGYSFTAFQTKIPKIVDGKNWRGAARHYEKQLEGEIAVGLANVLNMAMAGKIHVKGKPHGLTDKNPTLF